MATTNTKETLPSDWDEHFTAIHDGVIDAAYYDNIIASIDHRYLWVVIDGSEDDRMYITTPHHYVNRVGYVIASRIRTEEEDKADPEYLWYDPND